MSKKQISFATFNLYNLQLPGKAMYKSKTPYTASQYKRKIEWTASILSRLQADVFGFQELWSEQCLLDAFTEAGLNSAYSLVTNTDSGSISNALAVKKTSVVVEQRWIESFPPELVLRKARARDDQPNHEMVVKIKEFSRPLLQATIQPDIGVTTPDIVVCVSHLKSKLPIWLDTWMPDAVTEHREAIGSAMATIRRTAEAGALRIILNKLTEDIETPVVVLGDLNDAQLSVTTSLVTSQPSLKLFEKSRAGRRSNKGLYSTAILQELRSLRDVYYTHIHEGLRESLDHILVSEQFYDHSVNREWSFHEMRILNDHLDEENPEASDHGAVMAVFDHNPYKK